MAVWEGFSKSRNAGPSKEMTRDVAGGRALGSLRRSLASALEPLGYRLSESGSACTSKACNNSVAGAHGA